MNLIIFCCFSVSDPCGTLSNLTCSYACKLSGNTTSCYCKSGYILDTANNQTCKGNLLTDQIKGTYSLYINYNANTVVPLLSGQNSGVLRYQHTKLSPSREATPHIRPLFDCRTEIPTYNVVPFKRGHPSYKATF